MTATSPRVLVTYGSRNGSTAEIAEMLVDTFTRIGVTAVARPAYSVTSVDGFDAVVIGGALYSNRWHPDARRLVRRQAVGLRGRPVWLFSSGPLDASADEQDIPPVPQVSRAMRQLDAMGHATFGGRLGPDASGFIARAMVRNGRCGDFRNRDRVAAWSRAIGAEILATAGRPAGAS